MIIAVKIDFGNDKAIILSQVAKDRRSNFSFGDAIKTDFGMLSFCENSEIANYKAPFEYVNDCLRIKETVHYTCD